MSITNRRPEQRDSLSKEPMSKLLIFFFVLTLAGCSLFGNDDDFQGEISARINGQAWPDSSAFYATGHVKGRASIGSRLDDGVSIILDTYNQQVFERIRFPHLPKQVGRYRLTRTYLFHGQERSTRPYRRSVYDDVSGDSYRVDETAENYVEITSYDSTRGRVTGTFAFTAIIDTTHGPPTVFTSHLNTVRFTEGRFEVPLVDDK